MATDGLPQLSFADVLSRAVENTGEKGVVEQVAYYIHEHPSELVPIQVKLRQAINRPEMRNKVKIVFLYIIHEYIKVALEAMEYEKENTKTRSMLYKDWYLTVDEI